MPPGTLAMIPAHLRKIVRIVLYGLKKRFGRSLVLRSVTSVPDTRTGNVAYGTVDTNVRRAVVLPRTVAQKFAYDISYLAANKNFCYGGYFDEMGILVIIEKRDAGTFNFDVDTSRVVIDEEEYTIIKREETIDQQALILAIKVVEGDQNES